MALSPRFELSFTVTARNASADDVTAMLTRLAEIVGKDAIQVIAPAAIVPAAFASAEGRTALPLPAKTRHWSAFRRMTPAEKRVAILEALRAEKWAVPRAAERLGIARPTLTQWMLDLRIPKIPMDDSGEAKRDSRA